MDDAGGILRSVHFFGKAHIGFFSGFLFLFCFFLTVIRYAFLLSCFFIFSFYGGFIEKNEVIHGDPPFWQLSVPFCQF